MDSYKLIWIFCLFGLLVGICMPVKGENEEQNDEYKEYVEDGNDDYDDEDSRVTKPPVFISKPSSVDVLEGEDIRLECKLEHLRSYTIFWNKSPNKSIAYGERFSVDPIEKRRFSFIEPEVILLIKNASLADAGVYNCSIAEVQNVNLLHSVIVRAKEGKPMVPRITLEPSGTKIVDQGQTLSLTCDVRTEGKQNLFIWQKKSHQKPMDMSLEDSVITRIDEKHARNVLTFRSITRHQAGEYICLFEDDLGKAESTVRVEVNYPPVVTTKSDSVHSEPGRDVELLCTVHAQPRASVSWYKSERRNSSTLVPLRESSSYKMRGDHGTHSYKLHIGALKESDYGVYTCEAKNGFEESGVGVIEISGAPSQPKINEEKTKLGEEHMSYDLVWKVESSLPIDSSILRYRKEFGNWSDVRPVATQYSNQPSFYEVSYTLKNLTPSTNYETTLLSSNKNGWSREARLHKFYINGKSYQSLESPNGSSRKATSGDLLLSSTFSIFLILATALRRWE